MMGVEGFLKRICPVFFYKGDSPKIILASVASGTMARGNTLSQLFPRIGHT